MEITKAIEELEKNRPKICKWENYDNPDKRRFIGVFPDHETTFGRALDVVIKAMKKDPADKVMGVYDKVHPAERKDNG